MTVDQAGFRLSVQQSAALESGHAAWLGARGLFAAPRGATPGDLRPVLAAVWQRHEILRSRIDRVAGVPLQFIDGMAVPDCAVASTGELNALFEAPLRSDAPLACAWVEGDSQQPPALLLSIGALWGDAATLSVIAAELYRHFGGHAAAIDPIQYADYAQWQHEQIEGDATGRAFWLAQPTAPMPRLWFERAAQAGFRRAALPVMDDVTLPEAQLLALWAAWASRHAGDVPLAIGVVDPARNDEVADACGPYARVLPMALPSRLSHPRWGDWQSAIEAARVQTMAHAQAFTPTAGREGEGDRLPSRELALQYRAAAPVPGALRLESVEAPFLLRLEVDLLPDGARLQLAYDAHRVEPEAAREIAAQLRAVVNQAQAGVALDRLSLLHPLAHAFAAAGLTQAEPDLAHPPLLHEAIAACAQAKPDAPAVACAGQVLSYAELDAAANRLAQRLVAAGAGPDQVVGVCIERSVDLLVGLLGVLKSGAAYLPLDPGYPPERLIYMLKDSGAIVVVAHEATRGRTPGAAPIVWLHDESDEANEGVLATLPRPHPDHLAYLIYTSGSTGRPKGVAVTHRNAAHSTLARERWYERRVGAYLLLSSVAFDSSVAGIFWTLTQGGTLVLPRDDEQKDPRALVQLVDTHRVTHLLALPSLHEQLLNEARAGEAETRDGNSGARRRLHSLTDVIVAGEACLPALVDAHHAALPGVALFNEYGPTEASVWSVAHLTRPGEHPVPIGRAIPFIRAHVLDDDLALLAPGLEGELYVAGPALARGYLGRPDLTAERFVPNPYPRADGSVAGERLYRTGDRVRWQPDGRLDFLGRVDQQVKIRGFRIELGEIEARLITHAGVREAATIVREDWPGERRIVAYVLPRGDAPTPHALRQHLALSLPEYQLPSVFVVLASLPRTPNGKLDRQALPAPESAAGAAYEAPRNVTESLVAAIWSDVLGLDRIGVHDNFFELGGHSLVAAQVITRVRRSFGIELPVRELFAAPTVAGLALAVQQQRPSAQALEPIEAVPRDGALPLSFAQQRLWFLAQLDPNDVSYHIPGVVRLAGTLDAEALAAAFDALVRRHEVLRTRFQADAQGRPVQVIDAEPATRLLCIDVDDEEAADAFAQQEAMRPFSLADGPLLRFTLLRLAPDVHRLVVVMHHIISDGGSTERLLQELGALYAQALNGEGDGSRAAARAPLATPPLALQYADYAAWQRRHLDDTVLAGELAHWRSVLGGEQPQLALPCDKPRPAMPSGHGARVHLQLPAGLSREAVAFARRHNATLFMLLESVFAALLSRHTGQADVRVGTPVSARPRLELEPLLGLFVNTVVLRHDLSRAPGLAELLSATRHAVLDASQHAQLPFERLVDALAPERDLSRAPLFQAMFDMQTERYAALDALPGVRGELSAIDTPTAKFDLSLSVAQARDGSIDCSFEYSTDLFERATIERLAQHYALLLQAGLQTPHTPVVDLPMLSNAEAASQPATIVHELPLDAGFAALFVESAERHAARVAADDGRTVLTHAELCTRARALAARLQTAGVQGNAPVAVLLARSNDYLVAVVACLLAGAAYVPLDVSLPEARIAAMIESAQPVALIGTAEAARWCRDTGGGMPRLVSPVGPSDTADAAWRAPRAHPDQLAYVIYTSGSTGTPKGAMVTQRGMLNNLLGKVQQLGLTPADRIAQTASPCFDISVWQFLTALLCGASVQIVPDAVVRDPAALLGDVQRRGITVLESVPSLMRGMLADPDAPRELPSLRWLLPTGEALQPALAAQWLARHPRIPLLNAYGPAECADDVALWRIDVPPPAGLVHLPIGTPAANLRLHVVNDALQLQPAGVTGELAIGGVGVGRGYLGDPVLTAERFVPDPFGPPGARLYRSGDLVRCAVEGVLTFIGRRDHQVKIRGHRVELGEIEARLLQQPSVRAAAVVVHGEPARLVAYVVLHDAAHGATPADALRSALAEHLPDAMLPAAFVALPELPLNANGKLDRARLPAPDFSRPVQPDARPRSAAEAAMAEVWTQVLGVPEVGLHDNFFALGGDSILTIQVVSRARQAGWKISAKALFQHPTVEALAAVAQRDGPAVERTAPQGALPLTPVQHEFFERTWPNPEALNHWNQSLLLTPARALDAATVEAVLSALVAHHDALRLRFSRQGGAWQAAYADAETAALLQGRSVRDEAELMAACDAVQASLDIERGPLLRAGLFDLPDGSQRLLLAVHHLVVDGVSWRVLLEDFTTACMQRLRGEPLHLPARSASFKDWALHLQAAADGGLHGSEAGYWMQQVSPSHAMPFGVEHPEGRNTEGEVHIAHGELDAASTALLLQSARLSAKPDDFLLTALARAMQRWSGQPALVVEQEGHGRPEEPDVSRTVGWFTAAYPVVLALPPGAGPMAQLKHVKQVLRSVPGGGVGYGVLRHLTRSVPAAAVQLGFNYLGQLDASVDGRVFSQLHNRSGRLYHAEAPRVLEFELNAYVLQGRLQLDWSYSRSRWNAATVQSLLQAFLEELATLLAGADAQRPDLLTPQDFPDVALDAATLEQLLEGME